MTIVSKDKKHIINFDYVTDIFIGSNEVSIKVNFSDGKGCELERYYSQKDASVAMEMLCDAISRNASKFEMPTEKQIQAKVVQYHDTPSRHISGKKNKGHGGS